MMDGVISQAFIDKHAEREKWNDIRDIIFQLQAQMKYD